MKKLHTIIAALLIVALAVSFAACSHGDESETTQPQAATKPSGEAATGTVTLPVAQNDSLDPFKAKSTVNRALIPLIYDGLVFIDESFEPQPLIAQNFSVNGKQLTVSLKANAKFSDSSSVTADDVVYSFDNAKKSEYYSGRLSNLASASASGNSVVFSLKAADVYAAACLDFPIVKSGTIKAKSDSAQSYDIVPPVGCGRFALKGTMPDAVLVSCSNSLRGSSSVGSIALFEVSDSDGMAYGLEIGNYDYWYDDLSGGEYSRINAGMSVVPTNCLIYLGFNSNKAIFSEAAVRKAVSLMLDRDLITSQGYQGHAAASVLPFNPAWGEMKNIAVNGKTTADTESAKAVLEKAGYTSVNYYGYRCSSSKSLTCSLTVCKDNAFKVAAAEQIKEQLSKLNFNVKIIELAYDKYVKAIKDGDFEMYLGEIKLLANMSLSPFYSSAGAAYTGVDKETGVPGAQAYSQFSSGALSLSDFCLQFENEMPFVPICFRYGVAIYSRAFTSEIKSTCYDGFYNIGTWSIK